jgi:ubiquinol oxidase
VKTYTSCINQINDGTLAEWATTPAPPIAVAYWRLKPDATMRDVLLAIRADEAIHRDVNHAFADIGPDAPNPFA